ncbi:MAG: Asp-tRNA(Asn)/Glu-tRNA(Gln) amidotransferase subunit GatA [Peptococcaceae bacterium]|nr:Asp-tRNA(Asn)/Glu-tRNA(Gln) amidotransferase subunit GatA [Peptococcaceae bacterium]
MTLSRLTIHELHEKLTSKEISAVELAKEHLHRIETIDTDVKAYLKVTADVALAQAEAVDKMIANGEKIAPLAGIPMALKDNMCTEGIETTCASKMLENFKPQYDAAVVEKLHSNHGVMLGKVNMDEFAMGSTTENSAYFATKNPWNFDCVPGGSSGGSAAAVAADLAVYSLGSDTGGSIRQPAAFCGLVGLKPTYGAVSRYGLIAFASSLDQIGPLTKDVTDAALVMNAIAGHDHRDSTSANIAFPDYTAALDGSVQGMRIGIPEEYFGEGIDPEVEAQVRAAAAKLEELGAVVEVCSLPHTRYAMPAYYLIAPAEASSNLGRYDGVRYGLRANAKDVIGMFKETRNQGFGDEVKRRIMLGTYGLSSGYYDAYYLKALKVRNLIKQDFDAAFAKYDCLITPTAPTTALVKGQNQDPLALYKGDICTIPSNLAGIPALSLPYGLDSKQMPVGVQLLGKAFGEPQLLKVAYALEQNTDLTKLKPNQGKGL